MQIIETIRQDPLNFILIIFILSFIIQIIYYLGIYIRVAFHKDNSKNDEEIPLSVIICAKDEEENLKKNLPSILEQDYPNFEVIVVNDGSSDDTNTVLDNFQKKYSHLRTTEIKEDEKFTHGKKLAITIGIKATKCEWLVFTDADCKPISNKWLKRISEKITPEVKIILGYGGYYTKPTLLNNIIRYDTVSIALHYFSYALAGFPYMGVGRNMAYKKSLFYENKGFSGHYHIDSGDDDLFINQTANKKNTEVCMSADAMVLSQPKETLSAWFRQKKRHLTTSKFYKGGSKFRLGMEIFSRLLFYASFVFSLIFFPYFYIYILSIFAFRMALQMIITGNMAKKFNEKYIVIPAIFYDIFIPFFNFIVIVANKISRNNNRWT